VSSGKSAVKDKGNIIYLSPIYLRGFYGKYITGK